GAPCDPGTPVVPRVTPEELAAAHALLAECGLPEGAAFVALSPNVSDLGAELRRWPPERWSELADRLWSEVGLPSVFVGAPSDVEYVATILNRCATDTRAHSLAGRTSLGELAALVSLAGAVVACASGPVPLAECLGTPTVALFGTETPVLYGLRGEQHRTLYTRPYCSPCLSVFNEKKVDFTCDHRCMAEITVGEVLQAVGEIVRR
ncbi:MAG: glycosyltransferase family 9 protein, partial [Armatimonadota bacterium]